MRLTLEIASLYNNTKKMVAGTHPDWSSGWTKQGDFPLVFLPFCVVVFLKIEPACYKVLKQVGSTYLVANHDFFCYNIEKEKKEFCIYVY
jgi:hypothetical protein